MEIELAVIKSEVKDDSIVNDLIKNDTMNEITSSVKKEPVPKIPLDSFHSLLGMANSRPLKDHLSCTSGFSKSSVKVEGHDCNTKEFTKSSVKVGHDCSAKDLPHFSGKVNSLSSGPIKLPKSSGKIRKLYTQSQKIGTGTLKGISDFAEKSIEKKEQRNSYASIYFENDADKLKNFTELQSPRTTDKIKLYSSVCIKNALKLEHKKEVGSPCKSRSNRKYSEAVTENPYGFDEEKPNIKLWSEIYYCYHCPSTFSRKDYWKLHLMHHTKERPFKCDVCNKGFRMRWRVKLHRATHFDDKPHRCKFCSYRSVRRDGLLSHVKRIHKNVITCSKNCLVDHFH